MVPWMRIPVPLRGCAQEESGEDVMGQVMNSAKVAAWSWMAYLVDALEPRDLMTMARSAVVLPLCGRLTTLCWSVGTGNTFGDASMVELAGAMAHGGAAISLLGNLGRSAPVDNALRDRKK